MKRALVHVSVLVEDYDEAIEYYTGVLGFELIEDTPLPDRNKRWVLVRPEGSDGAAILLAKASNPAQATVIGNQAGGRVFLFLGTENFWRDYELFTEHGVKFVREPSEHDYGTVAVFEDLYGNLWDLVEHKVEHRFSQKTAPEL